MVNEDIERSFDLINNKLDMKYLSNYYMRLYAFSSENLNYLRGYQYQGKSVLTTGSSCDQAFNLINYGCENITLFDINPFVKYYYELKRAALINLSRDDFLNFLHSYFFKKRFSDYRTYQKISMCMSKEAKDYWDGIINRVGMAEVGKKMFIEKDLRPKKATILNNDYLEINNYNKMKRKLENVDISIVKDDLINLKYIFSKYDYIILSNIFDSLIRGESNDERIINYRNVLYFLMGKYLNINGYAFFQYLWRIDERIDFELENSLLSDENIFKIDVIDSCRDSVKNGLDRVYVYRRRK